MKKLTGKIASLPIQIRCEVSKRISKKEPSGAIAQWLNDQMAILEVLEEKFDDAPITELDIEEWQAGGFLEWIPNTDFSEHALVMSGHASDMRAAGLSTNDLFMVVLAMHAQVLRSMDILPSEVISRRMDMVERMTKSVLTLRRSEKAEARKEVELARLELAREKQHSKSESSASSPALSSAKNSATLRTGHGAAERAIQQELSAADNPASLHGARSSATPAVKPASSDQSVDQLSSPPDSGESDGDLEITAPKGAFALTPSGDFRYAVSRAVIPSAAMRPPTAARKSPLPKKSLRARQPSHD